MATIPIAKEEQPEQLALTPDDRALLHDAGRVLVAVELASQATTKVLARDHGAIWAWAPSGDLAVFDGLELHRRSPPKYRARGALALEPQRGQRLRCAPGLAVIGGAGLFCAYRMEW